MSSIAHDFERREAFCIVGVGMMDGAFCMMTFVECNLVATS